MLMSLWPYTQHELFWFARRRLVTHLRAVSSGLIWALFAKKGLMPTLCQFKFHPQWFQGLIIEVNNELSFGLGCWVSACVCFECAHVPVPSIVTSSDGEARGGGAGHPAPLPASCHRVSPKSDRQWQTHCHGPKISYSLSSHPSVRMCQCFLASVCCLSIFHCHLLSVGVSRTH